MRKVLLPLLALLACARERPLHPPVRQDRLAELRSTVPGEFTPAPWMFGCYSTRLDHRDDPAVAPPIIELTSEQTNPESPAGLRKYRATGRSGEDSIGEWWLTSESRVRISLGVPFVGRGWFIDVALSPGGGRGFSKFLTDGDIGREPSPASFVKVRCP
jgi:hypothetical protein